MTKPQVSKLASTYEQPLLPGVLPNAAPAVEQADLRPDNRESPNGGSVDERLALHKHFEDRLTVNPDLTRKAVSYQGNRNAPGFRWMKYKEGFSRGLVERLIEEHQPQSVLDPFSGIGTTPLIAAGKGLRAAGIEIIPVGVLTGNAIAHAANGLRPEAFRDAASSLIEHVKCSGAPRQEHAFRHVRITEAAFPEETEEQLARAREFVSTVEDPVTRLMLDFACMSVLESVSYTRKDGQYLRWDHRSGRQLRARVDIGQILAFPFALETRLSEMTEDLPLLKRRYGKGEPEFISGSSLERLRLLPDSSFDMVITSPPYANRYDYTRTYALELAWLGYDQDAFSALRQSMLTSTVENKPKWDSMQAQYGGSPLMVKALEMYEEQGAVQEALTILRERKSDLSNPHVIRLIEGYFLEMAVIVAELGRIVRPGGTVIMVNDNVQYHGEEVPVDLILSDYAEQSGFVCENIWALPRGKGNSSQQMGRFGRRELRKCVYKWVRGYD